MCALVLTASFLAFVPRANGTSQEFRVFFGDDTSDLSPRALGIIAAAAAHGRSIGWDCARLVGSSDRTDPRERRQIISRLRAETVGRELVRLGMRPGCMIVEACADTVPLVPTRDGVPEQHNRRVEIWHFPESGGPRATLHPALGCPAETMPQVMARQR